MRIVIIVAYICFLAFIFSLMKAASDEDDRMGLD